MGNFAGLLRLSMPQPMARISVEDRAVAESLRKSFEITIGDLKLAPEDCFADAVVHHAKSFRSNIELNVNQKEVCVNAYKMARWMLTGEEGNLPVKLLKGHLV